MRTHLKGKGGKRNDNHTFNIKLRINVSHLGGVVVCVLATEPKDRGFKPGQGDGF
jgi:phosphopantetheinyl transferase